VDGPFRGQCSGSGQQGGRDAEDPAWRGPGQAPGVEDLSVLDDLDVRHGNVGARPGQEAVAGGGGVAGPQDLGTIQRSGGSAIRVTPEPGAWRVRSHCRTWAPTCGRRARRCRQCRQGAAGCQRRKRRVCWCKGRCRRGPSGGGVDVQAGGAGELVLGDPVPGGDDGVQWTVRRAPVSRFWISTDSTRFLPLIRVTRVRAATGTWKAKRPASRNAA
jgi:hypothetical protein